MDSTPPVTTYFEPPIEFAVSTLGFAGGTLGEAAASCVGGMVEGIASMRGASRHEPVSCDVYADCWSRWLPLHLGWESTRRMFEWLHTGACRRT